MRIEEARALLVQAIQEAPEFSEGQKESLEGSLRFFDKILVDRRETNRVTHEVCDSLAAGGLTVGTQVSLTGDHPWADHLGKFIGCRDTPFGVRPFVELDNGHEVFVVKPNQWVQVVHLRKRGEAVRHLCTADDPWSPDKGTHATHPDAVEIGDQVNGWPGGDTVTMSCPHCRVTFEVELPQ